MQYESPIGRALATLRAGQKITTAQAAELREQGYDVPALVQRYYHPQ